MNQIVNENLLFGSWEAVAGYELAGCHCCYSILFAPGILVWTFGRDGLLTEYDADLMPVGGSVTGYRYTPDPATLYIDRSDYGVNDLFFISYEERYRIVRLSASLLCLDCLEGADEG